METEGITQAAPKMVAFPNGRSARLLSVTRDRNPRQVLSDLDLTPPQALIVIAGGAGNMSPKHARRLAPFFSLGIARAAKKCAALIVDGGTQAGVMALMGEGVADQGYQTDLLGIAPTGKIALPGAAPEESARAHARLDPNHSHFVLVEGQSWGDETDLMYNLAEALRLSKSAKENGSEPKALPIVTILAGGRLDGVTLGEARSAVRRGWRLLVLEGSGQLADEIARRYRSARQKGKLRGWLNRLAATVRRWSSPELQAADAFINEIIEDGQISLFSLKGSPSQLEKLLVEQLAEKPADSILLRAWQRFALYSQNSAHHQRIYRFLKSWPLILGVLATGLVLLNQFLASPPASNPPLPPPFDAPLIQPGDTWYWILHVLIVLTPILIALFLAADRLFKAGNKWLLLRFYAEQIKKDIYAYRVLSALRQSQETDLPDQAAELAASLGSINRRLMRTEVNESALSPYTGPVPPTRYAASSSDDGLRPLDPEEYLRIRVSSQLDFYSSRANRLERQLRPRQWLILIFGAVGSLLAALGGAFQFWVPLSVSIVSALTAYLEYQQVEQNIIKYNQAMAKLWNLTDWWTALSAHEKTDPLNIVRLVEDAERVMQSEHLGWMQQMQSSQTHPDKTEATGGAASSAEGNPEGDAPGGLAPLPEDEESGLAAPAGGLPGGASAD
jgi:hypothetical protein